jgi:hypothetical protein
MLVSDHTKNTDFLDREKKTYSSTRVRTRVPSALALPTGLVVMASTSSSPFPAAAGVVRRGDRFNLSDKAIGALHYVAGAAVTAPVVIAGVAAYQLLRRRPGVALVLALFGAAWLLHRRRQQALAVRATAA